MTRVVEVRHWDIGRPLLLVAAQGALDNTQNAFPSHGQRGAN
jgi:hypothetical protein